MNSSRQRISFNLRVNDFDPNLVQDVLREVNKMLPKCDYFWKLDNWSYLGKN